MDNSHLEELERGGKLIEELVRSLANKRNITNVELSWNYGNGINANIGNGKKTLNTKINNKEDKIEFTDHDICDYAVIEKRRNEETALLIKQKIIEFVKQLE